VFRTVTGRAANALVAVTLVAWLFTLAAGIVGGGQAIRHRDRDQHDLLYAAYGVVIYLGATTTEWITQSRLEPGRWSRRSPGSLSSGSSS